MPAADGGMASSKGCSINPCTGIGHTTLRLRFVILIYLQTSHMVT